MGDFYFAYDYTGETATRLYRFIDGEFERYDPVSKSWVPAPEQCRIFVGDDVFYEEVSEEQARRISVIV